MELDDLKNTWDNINTKIKQQQNLTPFMIDKMTRRKYYSKIKRIAYPEIVGVIICLITAFYIAAYFNKLDTPFLKAVGIVSILLLLMLSLISLFSLRQLNIKGGINRSYAETLKMFAAQKLQFGKLQKANITLSYLLLVTVIILLAKLFYGRDITGSKYFWTFSFTGGYIFLLFFSKLVSKFYNKTLRQAEELLKELQS
jgi:hypothetical protein